MESQLTHLPRSGAIAFPHPAPGRLGQYRLLQPIGEGGTAVVHLAVGPDDQMVAIKMPRQPAAASPVGRVRLAREVMAMRQVRSSFVAQVIDADLTGDVPYIVTTFVQGPTLAQVVADQGPLRGPALRRAAYGLAAGLAAVHAAGIVHRDVTPGNVMMAGGDPVLIDFGICHQAEHAPLTQTGTFLGTAGYLAPEVIEGQTAGASADVHGWGTTVGFAARGDPVYGTGPHDVVLWRILRGEAELDRIPGALAPLVAAALLRQPQQRPSAARLTLEVANLDITASEPSAATVSPARAVRTATSLRPLASHPPGRQRARNQRPAEVADLPAVRQVQLRSAVSTTRMTHPARRPHRRPLLGLAALALAVSASVVLPVAGTVTVATMLTLLRAAYRARTGLAGRRSHRGPRSWDPALLLASIPWVLARSAIETVLLAPLLLAAAGGAFDTATRLLHGAHLPSAWAAIAGAYTALSCLGPGSRPVRRQLHRVLNALASSPLEVFTTMLTLGTIAMFIAAVAIIQPGSMWPLPDPLILHLPIPGHNLVSLHS